MDLSVIGSCRVRTRLYSPDEFGDLGFGRRSLSGSPFPGGSPPYPTHLFDPHELVSWVNKVCKLDTDALPTFRVSLVLAASSGEHK
ncbi:hypothetical protein Pla100_46650 [Neorhodopirellula pilleata]|uniref:Uncharacterized protein n=1 Tax=Neorhodopirellula pilleata TaxID=2714738 RepID=A0A5C5ZZT9_9BACT|nr:hypothetical protein Pla100_46650 [Neorhodopirellula pilleata]